MLDKDLAELYGVDTNVLKQAVRRNIDRFPFDFMFELTKDEFITLRSQFVTSNRGRGRYMPFAFTEQGVAMLSGALDSEIKIGGKHPAEQGLKQNAPSTGSGTGNNWRETSLNTGWCLR